MAATKEISGESLIWFGGAALDRRSDTDRRVAGVDIDPTNAERRGSSDRRFHTMDDKLAASKQSGDARRFTGASITELGGL